MGSGEAKRFRDLYGSAGRHGQSFWEEEKDNIGMKLLKGMGWSNGQGLGKNGEGRTDHVKQFKKKDNAGIGAKAGTRDEAFKASQELFNDVLARLSGGGGDGGATSESAGGGHALGSAATTVKGVLARRQMSRRFCRGTSGEGGVSAVGGMAAGSMAGASAMAEIFGRGAAKDASDCAAAKGMPATSAADEDRSGLQQTTSSLSLNDYFAQRRAQLGLSHTTAPLAAHPSKGFTLDDQAAFAESMAAGAYVGRRGLGLGGAGAGRGTEEEDWPTPVRNVAHGPMAAVPPPSSMAASAQRTAGEVEVCGARKRKRARTTGNEAEDEKVSAKAARKEARRAAKAEAKAAAQEEEARLEAKAAKKAAKRAAKRAAKTAAQETERTAAQTATSDAASVAAGSKEAQKAARKAARKLERKAERRAAKGQAQAA